MLEQSVDRAALSLPRGREWSELSAPVRLALQLAKVYREAYPPQEPRPELLALLATVPMPELRETSTPAIRELLERAGRFHKTNRH